MVHMRRHSRILSCTLVALVLSAVSAALAAPALAQTAPSADSIAEARRLYQTAAFGDSLAVLARLDDPAKRLEDPALSEAIDEYRTLCLLALGRQAEAERSMEALLMRHPLLMPGLDERPPKFVELYQSVRVRFLPRLAAATYAAAKRRYDAGDFSTAARHFQDTIGILRSVTVDTSYAAVAADLETLAGGFLSLAVQRLNPAQAAAVMPPTAPVMPPTTREPVAVIASVAPRVVPTPMALPGTLTSAPLEPAPVRPMVPHEPRSLTRTGSMGLDAALAVTPLDAAPPLPTATETVFVDASPDNLGEPFRPVARVYTAKDEDVIPPVVIEQRLPRWVPPFEMLRRRTFVGRVDLVIDVDGRVLSADIVQPSFNPYDSLVLDAVKTWRYRPASKRAYAVQDKRTVDYVLRGAEAVDNERRAAQN